MKNQTIALEIQQNLKIQDKLDKYFKTYLFYNIMNKLLQEGLTELFWPRNFDKTGYFLVFEYNIYY